MKRALACLLLLATAQSAIAGKVLVLKSDGRADAKTRARVDATIAKLAEAGTDDVSAGEITYTEATAMVGCKPEDAACRDEVLGMLAVDEIVIVSVSPKPGGFDVQVRRAGKGGASREAQTLSAPDHLDRLDGIAPLFGVVPSGPPTTPPPTDPTISTGPQDVPPELAPDPGPVAGPGATEPIASPVPVDRGPVDPHPYRRTHIAGMITGGAILTLGFISWAGAASVASEIADHPIVDRMDFQEIQDLEKKGDGLAGFGNLCFLAGLVVGGLSTYYYVRGRNRTKRAVPTTAVAPIVTPDTIGLSFGGTL